MTITDAQMLERWQELGKPEIPLQVEVDIYDLAKFLDNLSHNRMLIRPVSENEVLVRVREFLWRD